MPNSSDTAKISTTMSRQKRSSPAAKVEIFDKYAAYKEAVQAPADDVQFLDSTYRELRGKRATIMREDFCGTFALSCEWAKLRPSNTSYAIDLDSEPIEYGIANNLSLLTKEEQRRVHRLQENVLSPSLPGADLICGLNFSYFIFRERHELLAYFKNCVQTLRKGGILILDAFGGLACQKHSTDIKRMKKFTYYWEQDGFDPITHEATFHIHFKPHGKRTIKNAFTYNWRMWTLRELRDAMIEAGFSKTYIYWEGTARDGTGNGEFTRTEIGESCDVWIAYVVGEL